MAKWGVGEVSGARSSRVGIDQFGMLGVRTVMVDDRDGLVRLVRRSGVAHLQTARKGEGGAYLGLISPNSGNMSERGPQICLGMGRTGSGVLRWGCSPGAA